MRIPILSASRRKRTVDNDPSSIAAAAVEIANLTKKHVEKPVKLVYTHGATAETTAIMSENGILLGIKRGKADYFGTVRFEEYEVESVTEWFDEHEVESVTDSETGKVLFPFRQESA